MKAASGEYGSLCFLSFMEILTIENTIVSKMIQRIITLIIVVGGFFMYLWEI